MGERGKIVNRAEDEKIPAVLCEILNCMTVVWT